MATKLNVMFGPGFVMLHRPNVRVSIQVKGLEFTTEHSSGTFFLQLGRLSTSHSDFTARLRIIAGVCEGIIQPCRRRCRPRSRKDLTRLLPDASWTYPLTSATTSTNTSSSLTKNASPLTTNPRSMASTTAAMVSRRTYSVSTSRFMMRPKR